MNVNLEVSTFLLTLNCYTEVVSSLVVAFFSVNDFANGIKKRGKIKLIWTIPFVSKYKPTSYSRIVSTMETFRGF